MQPPRREELFFTVDGTLDSKSVSAPDGRGSKPGETIFGRDGAVRGRYSYTYEFEPGGNRTKRARSKWVTKGRTASLDPAGMTYRTITFY